jgi:glycosyltransferase involved in cell wall biosynthesis
LRQFGELFGFDFFAEDKMRVLQIQPYRFLGGPEKQTLALAEFAKQNLGITTDLRFYVGPQTRAEDLQVIRDQAEKANLNLQLHLSPRPWQILAERRRLQNACKGYNHLVSSGYVCDLLAAGIRSIAKTAVFHGWTAQDFKVRFYESIDAIALRRLDKIACVSKSQFQILKNSGVSESRLRWLPNSLDQSKLKTGLTSQDLRRELSLNSEAVMIGSIGRLSSEKGHEFLIRSVASLLKSDANLHLVLIGDGDSQMMLENLVLQMNLQKQIHFLGFRAEAYRYLSAFAAFVLPSLREGLPVVLLEAFALRVPVIATDVGGVSELVQDRKTGRLVKSGDSENLRLAIQETLQNPKLSGQWVESAERHLQTHFSLSQQARIWQEILNEDFKDL